MTVTSMLKFGDRNSDRVVQELCDTNGVVVATISTLQEGTPYTTIDVVGGGKKYAFNTEYVNNVLLAFETLVYAAMSPIEKKLTEEYVTYLKDGGPTSDVVLALDEYLGSL